MALTRARWIAAFAAGALLLLWLPLEPTIPSRRVDPVERALQGRFNSRENQVRLLAYRLRSKQLAESVVAVAARKPVAPYRQFMDASMPARLRPTLELLGPKAAALMGPANAVGVDVAFVYDTATRIQRESVEHWSTQADFVLPTRAGDRCTVIVRVPAFTGDRKRWVIAGAYRNAAAPLRLLGPCAYYGAFGMPGPRVAQWIHDGGWSLIGDGSWTQAPPPYLDYYNGWDLGYDQTTMSLIMIRLLNPTAILDLPVIGTACVNGDFSACGAAARNPARRGQSPAWNDNTFSSPQELDRFASRDYSLALGARSPTLMASMVRTLGRDGFQRFWVSRDSVSAALRGASGKPLDVWTHDWMVEQYGAGTEGLLPDAWALGSAALLIAFGLWFAIRFSQAPRIRLTGQAAARAPSR